MCNDLQLRVNKTRLPQLLFTLLSGTSIKKCMGFTSLNKKNVCEAVIHNTVKIFSAQTRMLCKNEIVSMFYLTTSKWLSGAFLYPL